MFHLSFGCNRFSTTRQGNYTSERNGFQTIASFIRGEGSDTYSNMPAYFKGVVLLQKAFCLCRRFRAGEYLMPFSHLMHHTQRTLALENRTSILRTRLLHIEMQRSRAIHQPIPGYTPTTKCRRLHQRHQRSAPSRADRTRPTPTPEASTHIRINDMCLPQDPNHLFPLRESPGTDPSSRSRP